MRNRNVEGAFHDTLRATSDSRGVYRLSGVPPGTHVLTFKGGALGFRAQPRSTLVVPGPGDVRHDVLLGTVSLEGIVMDAATRRPIVGAEVQVQSPHFAMTTTDSTGRYEFVDLTPGEHRLCAAKDGYGVLFTGSGAVLDGGATRRDLLLVVAAQFALRLRDEEGAAITAEAILSFTPAEDESGTRVSTNLRPDASGVVRYDKVLPARYVIAVRVKGYEPGRVKTQLIAGANDIDVVLRRKEGAEQPVLLEGVLRDAATGAPVAGARIEPRGTAAPYTMSDAAGRFTVRGSGERPTRVVIGRDGYGVEFAPVPAEGTFEMALRRAAELVLRVRGKDGMPHVGRLNLGINARDEGGTRIGTGITADASSTALYRRILPGRYDLTVGVDGGGKATLDVEIQPGRNEFDIDLR